MSNMVGDRGLEVAAKRFEQNLAKYPPEEQIAVGVISKNVITGCSWEFTSMNADIKNNAQAMVASKNCDIFEVTFRKQIINGKLKRTPGYMISMPFNYICQLLLKEAPGLIDQNVINQASERKKESVLALAGLLNKECKKTALAGSANVLRIGIYGTNDSRQVVVNGRKFNAFAVTFKELMEICTRYGYGVLRDDPTETTDYSKPHRAAVAKSEIMPPAQAMQHETAFMRELVVAPSKNALFIDLAYMG